MPKECSRCGDCCTKSPCGIALATVGGKAPCVALERVGDITQCGLMVHPSRYMDLGEETSWRDVFLGGVFAKMLGAGMGCCTSPATKALAEEMSAFHGKRVTIEEAVEMQMAEMGK